MPEMTTLAHDILSLVRIPSVTGSETALADHLEARLSGRAVAQGSLLQRRDDSLILLPKDRALGPSGGGERPLIVLAGHIDTVPRGDAPEPGLQDGRVMGRGACDMKAGVAVMMNLAEELPARAGFADRAYVFYTGRGGICGRATRSRPSCRGNPGCGQRIWQSLLEPTNGHLELGCNGSIHIGVTVHGKACHSARPWKGLHPLQAVLPWLEEILQRSPREAEIHGVVFREVVTLTTVHAGEARNVVPASMTLNLNLRYPPDRSPAEAEEFALSLCPAEAEVRVLDHSPVGRIDLEAPLYRHLCDSTGLPRRAKQGWTDVARFTAAGVPALNWGPGDPELAHSGSECVEVDSADQCLSGMKRFFLGPGPLMLA